MTYNYTKPRCPIAASYTGPGPTYGLPTLIGLVSHDPRSVHRKMPGYSFGLLCPLKIESIGPGPGRYGLWNMYHTGPYTPPMWTFGLALVDIRGFVTPAPGTYRPEDCMKVAWPHAPEYSFGLKHRGLREENFPAPNAYMLDAMMGRTIRSGKPQAPCYSLTFKNAFFSFLFDFANSPGPGAHHVPPWWVYLARPPIYSVTGKNYPPDSRTQVPGPGAHENEKVWCHKRAAPIYSFGIRHSPYSSTMTSEGDDD